MLNARELKVFYGVIQGLKGVDIDVYDREIVTLIGSNGAGKTSTLNGIVNLVRSSGRVSFLNDDISRSQTHQIVRRGLALVPEPAAERYRLAPHALQHHRHQAGVGRQDEAPDQRHDRHRQHRRRLYLCA